MKPILYISAAVMIGASIYGFADYKKTIRTAPFKNMYEEKKVTKPDVVSQKENVRDMTDPADKPEMIPPEKNIEKEKPVKKEIGKKPNPTTAKSSKLKKEKKLNTKLFSRAPLREYPEIKDSSKN
ncbi:MAG TPA: hypothetical protein VJU78_10830 [Chitinophagaceae bacterium]|nr:hypothetical protein [Chitinophagaceae bacterium]